MIVYINESFVINSQESILGFDQLYKGINLKSDSFLTGNVKGNADSATRLETARTINDVSFNGTSNIVITATTNQPLKPGDYILGSDFSGAFEDTWDIDATPENLIGKVVARDSTGSFSATTVSAGEFVGTLLGNVTTIAGTSTFNDIIVNRITGNTFSGISARADRLTARRTINTIAFDGTEDIILPVPAETLTGNTLAPNVVASSLTTLGQLEYLNVEAPGITIGDGNNLNIKIEGFTPTIESDTTNILKLKLATGAVSTSPTTLTFLSASAAAADGVFAPAFAPDYTLGTAENNRPVLGLPSHRWKNIYSKEATLDTLNVTTLKGRTVADQVAVSKDLIINGMMYGAVTGTLTGSASLNVLKTGDTMTGDLVVGSTTKSGNSVVSVRAGDSFRAGFEAYGSNQGTGYLYIGQSTDYGGGVSYNGDNNPGFITGEQTDTITFFRRNAGANTIVFEYPYNSDTVTFKGTVVGTFSGNGAAITNINATNVATGTINPARLTGTYTIGVIGNVTGNLTGNVAGNVTGNLQGNVTGNITGNVTGAASLNVLKTGDTMTGDLNWATTGRGLTWGMNTDGASIKFYNVSDGDAGSRLEFQTSDNGNEYFSWTHLVSGGSTVEAMRLVPNTVNGTSALRVYGNLTVDGTTSGTFSGVGTNLTINAEKITIGTVPRGRLSGTYDISVTGNANYATSAGTATANIQRSGDTMTGRLGQHITGFHAASIGSINTRTNSGFFDNPTPTTAGGWPVTGSWYHLLSSTHVNDANYYAMQFSADFYGQNLYYRSTAGNGDTAWSKILHSNNYNEYSPTKTGGGASGTWAINISGNSATATSVPWTGVTGKPNVVVNDGGTYSINVTGNAGSASILAGGTSDANYLRFRGYVSGDAGADSITGMGTYGISMPGYSDTVIHFGTSGGSSPAIQLRANYGDSLWFRVARDSETQWDGVGSRDKLLLHSGNYNSFAPTLTGGNASGTWPINISGTAAAASSVAWNNVSGKPSVVINDGSTYSINITGNAGTSTSSRFVQSPDGDRNPNTKLPITSGQSVRFDFANAGYVGTGGNYAGVMTYAPWTGTTSSTGDASYQLAFGSTAINGSGTPQLRIRKGIDSTWNSWYDLLTSANYNSFSPTLTGGGASGTWGINITGNALSVSAISSSQVTNALGYVPVNPSTLTNQSGSAGNFSSVTATTGNFTNLNFSSSLLTGVGNLTPDGDLIDTGVTDLSDAIDYLNLEAASTSSNSWLSFAWMKGNWSSTYGAGGVFGIESNATNTLRQSVGLSRLDTGDTLLFGNVTSAGRFYNGFLVSDNQLIIKGKKISIDSEDGVEISVNATINANIRGNVNGNASTVSSITSGQVVSALGYTPANGSGPGLINGEQNYQDYNLKRATIIDYSLAHNALGNVSGSTIINMELGNYASATAVGAVNWGFTNPPTGLRLGSIILELTNGGAYTQYWPASVKWPSGTAPTLIAAGVDVLVFITDDGGVNWRGAISMSDSR